MPKDLNQKSIIIDNRKDANIRFVISYFRNTIDRDIVDSSSKDDKNNYRLIYNDIKRIFFKDNN